MELGTYVFIESMCGCADIDCQSHGKPIAPWQHDEGCQLYEPPEPSPDAEPTPETFADLDLTSLVLIKSNCACAKHDACGEPKRVLPHEHDNDCHFFRPQPSPSHEPYPESFRDLELTSLVIIRSNCACTKHDETKPVRPDQHKKDCHIFQPKPKSPSPEASLYIFYINLFDCFPSKLGIEPLHQ